MRLFSSLRNLDCYYIVYIYITSILTVEIAFERNKAQTKGQTKKKKKKKKKEKKKKKKKKELMLIMMMMVEKPMCVPEKKICICIFRSCVCVAQLYLRPCDLT